MGWQDAPVVSTTNKWQQAPVVEEPKKPERVMAALGGVNRGIANLVGLPVDTGENLINLGLTGYGAAKNAITGKADSPPVLQGSFGGSEHIAGLLQNAGVQTQNPSPDDTASRLLNRGGMIAGGSFFPGATVKNTLTAAAGGAIAGETLGEQYTGLGAIAPGAAGQVASRAKQAVASRAAPNAAAFTAAGVKPSVGLVTENTFFNGVENLLAKFPGSSGVITKFRENLQKDLGAKTKTGVSAEDAGRAIERGITGPGGFLDKTRSQWRKLDNAVSAKIPKGTAIAPTNSMSALDEVTAPIQGAEKTTAGLANPKLAKMRDDLSADMQAHGGVIPYEALRAIRTRVGSMMEDSLVSGVPGGELKKLYAGISKDLELAATQAGAGQAFSRQNQYYAARAGRIERVLERVIGKGKQPEEIYRTFYPTDSTQANKVRATLRSLPVDERRIVSQAVVERLGRAAPGKQDEFGEVFSSETFLTNWTKLSPGAKAQLFPEQRMREQLEAIATASSKLRHGSTAFNNTSGTAGSFAAYSIYSSPMFSLATGSPVPMLAAASAAGGANISARMLTSHRVVAWMAAAPKGDPKAVATHLARLSLIYNASDDEALKNDLEQYVQSMSGEQ